MLKKLILAMIPLAALASQVRADDFSVTGVSASEIIAAESIVETALDDIDLDQLAAQAGLDEELDADEAHFRFRRFGGYRHFGHFGYRFHRPFYGYRSFYAPTYHYPVYRPYLWGCY